MPSTRETDSKELQELAKRHLWLNFSRMGGYTDADIPIIVRGDGCYVWNESGTRFLDGLSSLFCTNIGHGRADIAQAGADQAAALGYFPLWSYAHPAAIDLASRIADLAPGDLNRIFFTSSGSEAVDSALKLVRQYHRITGSPNKVKVIAREIAYHGTTMGALSLTGITNIREPFEPMTPGGCHVPNTNLYRPAPGVSAETLADIFQRRIEFEGPNTVAAIIVEPVQNGGGCFTPPPGYFKRLREICDEYSVLLISDDVICAWGRLGEWFGSQRFDYTPDIITTAKGITSAYAPLGAMIASDRVMEPFLEEDLSFLHGSTYSGHPASCAIALANIDALDDEGVLDNVREQSGNFRAMLESLRDLPIVGDIRGDGFFHAIEIVEDQETRAAFPPAQRLELQRLVTAEVLSRGLICRVDTRGDLIVQLAPPLIAGPGEFAEIYQALRPALEAAANHCSM